MLISLQIDTALLSKNDYFDALDVVSYIEEKKPDWKRERCPVLALPVKPAGFVEGGDPNLPVVVNVATVATVPEGEALPLVDKPRRGRKPKEETTVAIATTTAAPEPTSGPAPEETVPPPATTEIDTLLEKFNAQMIEGELAEEKRTAALEKWRARGEEGIPELKKAIESNEEFLAKKRAAKAEASKINANASAGSSDPVTKVQKITLDMLRADLKYYTEKHGLDAGQELMKKYGASRISDMESKPVDKQIEFMKLCREQIHG